MNYEILIFIDWFFRFTGIIFWIWWSVDFMLENKFIKIPKKWKK